VYPPTRISLATMTAMNDVASEEKLSIHEDVVDHESKPNELESAVDWSEEKKLLRKLDLTLIPLFMIICQ
jgi:hypothetical protein